MQCQAWIFLVGSFAGTSTTVFFLYILARFPGFIWHLKSGSGTRCCRQIRNAAGARACHGYHACVRMRDEDEIPASANLKPRNIQSSVDLDDAYTSYKEVVASSHGNVLEFPRDLTAVIECACTITYVCPL